MLTILYLFRLQSVQSSVFRLLDCSVKSKFRFSDSVFSSVIVIQSVTSVTLCIVQVVSSASSDRTDSPASSFITERVRGLSVVDVVWRLITKITRFYDTA